MDAATQALFIGGRSGVGKTSVGHEIHEGLRALPAMHAHFEGGYLDMAYPPPWEHGLAERNLAALWNNYRPLGYHRLIYTSTLSVLAIPKLVAAMGSAPTITAVLLTADDLSIHQRLEGREIGTALDVHIERSADRARKLDADAPERVHRVSTANRTVSDIATEIIELTGWVSSVA